MVINHLDHFPGRGWKQKTFETTGHVDRTVYLEMH